MLSYKLDITNDLLTSRAGLLAAACLSESISTSTTKFAHHVAKSFVVACQLVP